MFFGFQRGGGKGSLSGSVLVCGRGDSLIPSSAYLVPCWADTNSLLALLGNWLRKGLISRSDGGVCGEKSRLAGKHREFVPAGRNGSVVGVQPAERATGCLAPDPRPAARAIRTLRHRQTRPFLHYLNEPEP
jgi:hypothetical protein